LEAKQLRISVFKLLEPIPSQKLSLRSSRSHLYIATRMFVESYATPFGTELKLWNVSKNLTFIPGIKIADNKKDIEKNSVIIILFLFL